MAKRSAGLLLFRRREGALEVLIVHPGGPFWARRDEGSWSIPKGELGAGEDPRNVAAREFTEELGTPPPSSDWIELGHITQAGAKRVEGWAVEGDLDTSSVVSNTVEIEWPPRSGQRRTVPEVDRAMWCPPEEAARRLVPAQAALVRRLLDRLGEPG